MPALPTILVKWTMWLALTIHRYREIMSSIDDASSRGQLILELDLNFELGIDICFFLFFYRTAKTSGSLYSGPETLDLHTQCAQPG